MSQLYHLYVADESEASNICDDPCDQLDYISVPNFWESKRVRPVVDVVEADC